MFLLHIAHASGRLQTITCASPFLRALWVISLSGQMVELRLENQVSA